jgi:hypothetical protein
LKFFIQKVHQIFAKNAALLFGAKFVKTNGVKMHLPK